MNEEKKITPEEWARIQAAEFARAQRENIEAVLTAVIGTPRDLSEDQVWFRQFAASALCGGKDPFVAIEYAVDMMERIKSAEEKYK